MSGVCRRRGLDDNDICGRIELDDGTLVWGDGLGKHGATATPWLASLYGGDMNQGGRGGGGARPPLRHRGQGWRALHAISERDYGINIKGPAPSQPFPVRGNGV